MKQDIRTYVALETAFTRRLVKDWKKRSGQYYEKIAAACRARNWDEARRLVPELDLTETGIENREWIKYLLLSFAVYGAGQVAKEKPSFVGVGSFDKTLNLVTKNMCEYLEHYATLEVQEQALQLIADDEAAHKAQKGNPYHDETGAFTSKEKASEGGVDKSKQDEAIKWLREQKDVGQTLSKKISSPVPSASYGEAANNPEWWLQLSMSGRRELAKAGEVDYVDPLKLISPQKTVEESRVLYYVKNPEKINESDSDAVVAVQKFGLQLLDGNHRAVAAHLLGMKLKVRKVTEELSYKMFPVEKSEYKYGSTQIDIVDESDAGRELNRLRSLISDQDLAEKGKDIGGNHVTIRYGVISGVDAIRTCLEYHNPVTLVLGEVIVFPEKDGACPVVVRIYCHELEEMNAELGEVGVFKVADYSYHPHATLAYVKPEVAEKYKLLQVKGQQYFAPYAVISDVDGVKEEVWFKGEAVLKSNPYHDTEGKFTDKFHANWDSMVFGMEQGKHKEHHTVPVEQVKKNPLKYFDFQNSDQRWEYKLKLAQVRGNFNTPYKVETLDPNKLLTRQEELFTEGLRSPSIEKKIEVIRTTIGDVVSDGNHQAVKALLQGKFIEAKVYETDEYKKVQKMDSSGRYVTPFVDFSNQGDAQLQLIAGLNGSRLATWGFVAEASIRGLKRYKLTAVLDGRTSAFCEEINGKEFEVESAREKIHEVLQVQNPDDLRTVQPWPKQTKAAMAEFRDMSTDDLVARGLHIPPFHPNCRTVCIQIGEEHEIRLEKPQIPEEKQKVPPQNITAETLKEIGLNVTPEQVDHWNAYIGLSPVDMLSKLSGKTPQEILDGALGKKAIQFLNNGDISTTLRGVMGDAKYSVGTVLDPFTGRYYLEEAALLAGDIESEKVFLTHLFSGLIDVGESVGAKSLVLVVGVGDAVHYAKLGFLPSAADWQTIRANALEAMDGSLKEMAASLSIDQKLLVDHILQNIDEHSLSVLADLEISYQGKSVGEWVLAEVTGQFQLDLTDTLVVAQAKEYLGIVQKANPYHDEEGSFTSKEKSAHLSKAGDREKWPEHIKALKLPPAWTDVRISHNSKEDLLAIGKDSKGRDQYVYSEKFRETQAALKFNRIKSLQKEMPEIDRQIDNFRKNGTFEEKEHADCMFLIRQMGIRPGSEGDTLAGVKAYGATTLEGKHVKVEKSTSTDSGVRLQFVGKKGVSLDLPVTNWSVAKMLKERKKSVGENGQLFVNVSDGSLRGFVDEKLDHGGYKVKDFRTHLGTSTAIKLVKSMPAPTDKKSYMKSVKAVAIHVSGLLGNTATVALQSYIAPQVFAKWGKYV